MTKSSQHFSHVFSHSAGGLSVVLSPSPKIWCLSKKKSHNWRTKLIKVLKKNIKKRKNKNLTEILVQYLIIGLILALVLLAGCSSTVCPDQTKIEVGVTETDAKNDKFQEKKLLTQTFKWGKKKCND